MILVLCDRTLRRRMVLPVDLVVFLLSGHVPALSSAASGECPPFFHCGNLGKLSFPYTTPQRNHCGMLPIQGCEDEQPNAAKTVLFGQKMFQVTRIGGIFNTHVSVRDLDLEKRLEKDDCDAFCCNITLLPASPLGSFQIIQDTITFYKCNISHKVSHPKRFLKYRGCDKSHNIIVFFRTQDQDDPSTSLAECPRVQLPVNTLTFSPDPFTFIASEFSINIQISPDCATCCFHKGSCRLNSTGGFFCSKYTGFGMGLGIMLLALVLCFVLYKQRQSALSDIRLRSKNQHPNNDADAYGGRLFLGVPIFSYMELQHATNNFDPSNKLTDGDFGSVYYGQLQDGREVAVKHLFNHNYKQVEQFMIEVEILTRLHHTNVVSLYGCTSCQSNELLLVYEYISNGNLASHCSSNPVLLTWPMRIKIAIETATALAYLHASGIIHCEVKTKNILLDKNFRVKVADFGHSRLFPNDVPHVSTASHGTLGYLDPKYHFFFRLTKKSDVYSFGVVLMELIFSMPAVDMGRNKDEITLVNLALGKIQRSEFDELVDPCLGIDKDSEVKKKVIAVGELASQCLQIDKEMRPSIEEVLEVLKEIERRKEEEGEDLEEEDQGKLFKSASTQNRLD